MHSTMLVELLSSEKVRDPFVIRQKDRRFCCFPQKVCKLKKCHVDCQKFFWVFLIRAPQGVRFPLWVNFLVRFVFDHESITSTPATWICCQGKLFSWNGLFQCQFRGITECFFYWNEGGFLVLMFCWLVLLLWALCRKKLSFSAILEVYAL